MPQVLLLNLIVAVAYAAGAYVGLKLAFIGEVVTLFWPPSGLAFAAVWIGGLRLVPGIGLGAFAINVTMSGDYTLAGIVACGSMAAPVAGVLGLTAVLARQDDERELRRVLLFILTALGSTLISATAGTWAMAATGRITEAAHLPSLVWWLGDAMGVLIVAPPILLWRRPSGVRLGRRAVEIGLLAVATTMILGAPLVIDQQLWASELGSLCTLLLCLVAADVLPWNGAIFR